MRGFEERVYIDGKLIAMMWNREVQLVAPVRQEMPPRCNGSFHYFEVGIPGLGSNVYPVTADSKLVITRENVPTNEQNPH